MTDINAGDGATTGAAVADDIAATVAGWTVPRRLLETVAAHGGVVALQAMVSPGDPAAGTETSWQRWTWAEVGDLVARAAAGLAHVGVGAGRPVLLMMRNRPEFHWLDLAVQFLRGVPISIYNSSAPDEIAYLAAHCEAEVAILEDKGFLDRLAAVRDRLPSLRHVFALADADADGGPGAGPDGRAGDGRADAVRP
jgi:long-chain acyl-CoA synthetase